MLSSQLQLATRVSFNVWWRIVLYILYLYKYLRRSWNSRRQKQSKLKNLCRRSHGAKICKHPQAFREIPQDYYWTQLRIEKVHMNSIVKNARVMFLKLKSKFQRCSFMCSNFSSHIHDERVRDWKNICFSSRTQLKFRAIQIVNPSLCIFMSKSKQWGREWNL